MSAEKKQQLLDIAVQLRQFASIIEEFAHSPTVTVIYTKDCTSIDNNENSLSTSGSSVYQSAPNFQSLISIEDASFLSTILAANCPQGEINNAITFVNRKAYWNKEVASICINDDAYRTKFFASINVINSTIKIVRMLAPQLSSMFLPAH